ncbi:hypothetical protein P4O66_004608 [Electrophorus voltai]|uniref:Beta-catenin-interacting protein 1 n=1 Tax=Electrophorus voltai TaxID=2609070 RepID=A0AAD8ZMH2_9TELE|nr:hypothetical protein P4O66_004608 [Electrophorus voltai]
MGPECAEQWGSDKICHIVQQGPVWSAAVCWAACGHHWAVKGFDRWRVTSTTPTHAWPYLIALARSPESLPRASGAGGMNREEAPGKSPEEMYVQQKVRVLLMLKKMGSNLTPSEEAFLRNYAGVVHSQMSQLPQHNIDQGKAAVTPSFPQSRPGHMPADSARVLGALS